MSRESDKRRWRRHLSVRRYATVGGRDIASVSISRDDGAYDGASEALMEEWGVQSESGGYQLFDSLDALLAELGPQQVREAAAARPAELASALAKAHLLGGRLLDPGDVTVPLLEERGMGTSIRYPSFDGEALTFQVVLVPDMNGPDREWRLLTVRMTLEGKVLSRDLVGLWTPSGM